MAVLLDPNNKFDLDSNYINETLKKIESILIKNEIYHKKEFQEWLKDFKKIYGKKQANLRLYISFALIYLIGYVFIAKFFLKNKNSILNQNISLNNLK
ncbi:MAG: hypothetical protein ACFE75_13800, partial [Candidatus Hodarchaeota archaeon]